MKVDLTEVVIALIGLLAAVVTGYLIPWIRKSTTEKQQDTIRLWTSVAIKAAEQLYGSKQGEQKKKYVLDFLDGKGFSVDDATIEAFVFDLFHEEKGGAA